MRILIIAASAMALSACQGMTPQQMAGTASSGLYAAATLARAGTIDEQLAPAYTTNAMVRQRAARALGAGRIDVATARAVLTQTDAARAALDAARSSTAPALATAHLTVARHHIAAAEKLMETPQ